ncbi:Cytosine-specific methyltransferase [uncultured Eubacteriales bacterium]|uniref:Cytosine-specific methyltransferase n=1 Tax=uncultured Eubacteriales bacterium TaxID=172733 RepID=A0A212JGQ3_9FIRM|nr:Cytosine-specific methyltransferase [uncultured Eubacteriales bacterium]
MFCGTGGFSIGFENYSNMVEVVAAVDILKVATETMKANHPESLVINNDIRNVNPADINNILMKNNKKVDIIIGGPPCQGFSSIRPFRSENLNDPRNSLFEQFVFFVEYFNPKVFVFENVVGLATHNNGKTIEIIQKRFQDIGYAVDWKVLNAANYGVPQKRERLIMIGGYGNHKVTFPSPTHHFDGKTIGIKDKKRQQFSNLLLPPAITVAEAICDLPPLKSGEMSENYLDHPQTEYTQCRRKNCTKLTMHNSTAHTEKMLEIIRYAGDNINCIPQELITSGFSTCYSRLRADEPASTITVNFVHPASNKCIHPFQDRALTPREGARLQSFDDDYIFCGTRSQIVKQIGNAVPPLLGQAIASGILRYFSTEPKC